MLRFVQIDASVSMCSVVTTEIWYMKHPILPFWNLIVAFLLRELYEIVNFSDFYS